MANSVFMRQITLTAVHQPLGGNEVYSVDISCPPTNSGPTFFKVGAGAEVRWLASEWHAFRRIKLSDITVRGTPGDVVSIVGGTWT
jgi:hypothetical protein